MSTPMDSLEIKFAALLNWERRKRREETLIAASSAAALLAIVLAPINFYLPVSWLRWFAPVALLAAVAPWFFYRARWRRADSARTLVRVDKSLRLDERAVTAWELTEHGPAEGAGSLVLHQADEKLRVVDPRALLPRRWRWPAFALLPLLMLWSALLWLDFDRPHQTGHAGPPTLAQRLREYGRELQQKAKDQNLRETLNFGRELEKAAQKNLDAKSSEETLRKESAQTAEKFSAAAKGGAPKDSFSSSASEQNLKDLQAEIAAARDLLELPESSQSADLGQRWRERLAALPQLKSQLESGEQPGKGLGQNELKAFLDKLERQVSGELDRRTVIDAQQYLEQMMKQGQASQGENYARGGSGEEPDPNSGGVREKNFSSQPGKEPGRQDQEAHALPELRAGASTQVKGQVGEGDSSALGFRGNPTPEKSTVSPAEIDATYRRQAEQELNSEHVPDRLKETIRNYFMSLGETNK